MPGGECFPADKKDARDWECKFRRTGENHCVLPKGWAGGVGATCVAGLNTASVCVCTQPSATRVVDLDIQGARLRTSTRYSAGIGCRSDMKSKPLWRLSEVIAQAEVGVHASGLHLLPAPSRMLGPRTRKRSIIPYFCCNLRREFNSQLYRLSPSQLRGLDWQCYGSGDSLCDRYPCGAIYAWPSRSLSAIDALGVGNRPNFSS